MTLERNLGKKLTPWDPVLAWMAGFAADVMARYRKGVDGKTPYERETGRKWAKWSYVFGVNLMISEARERRKMRAWGTRLVPYRYAGHHGRIGSVFGLTENGVVFGQAATKRPEAQRWDYDGWKKLKGLSWDMEPKERDAALKRDDDEVPAVFEKQPADMSSSATSTC